MIVRLRPQIAAQVILLKARQNGIDPSLLADAVERIVQQLYEQDGVFLAAPAEGEFIRRLGEFVSQSQSQNAGDAQVIPAASATGTPVPHPAGGAVPGPSGYPVPQSVPQMQSDAPPGLTEAPESPSGSLL